MYGIYANIWGILMVNVIIYSIHGSYGISNSIKSHYVLVEFNHRPFWLISVSKPLRAVEPTSVAGVAASAPVGTLPHSNGPSAATAYHGGAREVPGGSISFNGTVVKPMCFLMLGWWWMVFNSVKMPELPRWWFRMLALQDSPSTNEIFSFLSLLPHPSSQKSTKPLGGS